MIRYWSRSLLGMAICLGSLLFMTWALYHLVRTGTCASGGPYVSARPCPAGTGEKILGLMGSIFGLLIGGGIYASRGRSGNRGASGTIGMGLVLWSLLFVSLAVGTFVAAYGPANNGDSGAKTAAITLMIVFLPMGLLPLLGAVGFGAGRKRLTGRGSGPPPTYPRPAPPQWTPPIPPAARPAPSPGGQAGDVAARLRQLDELRDTGLLTDEEFEAKKTELLQEL
jgi:putative oligomerization/nucleic acid binding protein